MKSKFYFSPLANTDFNNIIKYLIENTSIHYAQKVKNQFYKKIQDACKEPELYQLSNINKLRKQGIRIIPVEGYLIFYRVHNNEIEIARVRSDKQDNRKLKIQ